MTEIKSVSEIPIKVGYRYFKKDHDSFKSNGLYTYLYDLSRRTSGAYLKPDVFIWHGHFGDQVSNNYFSEFEFYDTGETGDPMPEGWEYDESLGYAVYREPENSDIKLEDCKDSEDIKGFKSCEEKVVYKLIEPHPHAGAACTIEEESDDGFCKICYENNGVMGKARIEELEKVIIQFEPKPIPFLDFNPLDCAFDMSLTEEQEDRIAKKVSEKTWEENNISKIKDVLNDLCIDTRNVFYLSSSALSKIIKSIDDDDLLFEFLTKNQFRGDFGSHEEMVKHELKKLENKKKLERCGNSGCDWRPEESERYFCVDPDTKGFIYDDTSDGWDVDNRRAEIIGIFKTKNDAEKALLAIKSLRKKIISFDIANHYINLKETTEEESAALNWYFNKYLQGKDE